MLSATTHHARSGLPVLVAALTSWKASDRFACGGDQQHAAMYPHRIAIARMITRGTQWVALSAAGDHPSNGYAKGCGRNFFSRERCAAPRFARVPLTLAHLLLFHRRLDGNLRTTRAQVPVKIRCKSEQTLSVQRYMRPGSIVNAIT